MSDDELSALDRSLRRERLRRAGAVHSCEKCAVSFVGRSDARFCSVRCRVAAHRAARREQQR